LKKRALVLDKDERTGELISSLLEREGIEVHLARNAREALEEARKYRFDILLVDINFIGSEGFKLMEHIKAVQSDIFFAFLIKQEVPAERAPSECVTRRELDEFKREVRRAQQDFLKLLHKLYVEGTR